jgi:hypothetical protein
MLDFLQKIDFYGSPSSFTIFNKSTFQTHIGGFLTILTLIGYFLCFWYFGKDFYTRDNPNFLNQRITSPEYPLYNIGRDDLIIAFRMEDFDGNTFDITGLLDMEILYYNFTSVNGSFIGDPIQMETINCSMIDKEKMRMLSKKDLTSMSCIKLNNTPLGGFWDAEFLNYITIIYKPCRNKTNYNKCIPLEEAALILNQGRLSFNVYTNTYYSQLKDYDNPLKVNLYNVYSYIDTSIAKNLKLFYKLANITTDLGIILESPMSYGVFGLDYMLLDSIPLSPSFVNPNNDTALVVTEIFLNNNVETFNVAYIKIQETIANIGGFISSITVFLTLWANFFNDHFRTQEIINTLFDFNDLKNETYLDNLVKTLEKKPLPTEKSASKNKSTLYFRNNKDFESLNIEKNTIKLHKINSEKEFMFFNESPKRHKG